MIVWMDDFKRYGDPARMLDGTPWVDHGSAVGTDRLVDDPDPNITGDVYRVIAEGASSNFGDNARMVLTDPGTKIGIAVRIWLPSLPSNGLNSKSIHVMNASNSMIYHWSIRPNGSIVLYRGTTYGGRTSVADSVSPVLFAGSWNHFEFWIDTVSGEYWCAKEGVEIDSLTGTDGSPPSTVIGIVSFADCEPGAATQADLYIKDLIVMDDNGSFNNDPYIGPVSLYYLDVTADVSGAWDPSTGTDMFGVVDEEIPDDTDYLSADDSPPAAAIFTLENLPADIVGVRGLMMVGRIRKSDGGDAQVQMSLLSNGDEDSGADRTVTTSFAYYWDVSEADPDTATTWTPTGVNGATFKINRTV